MGSKLFLLLGLLMAIVLLISSEAAARNLAETSIDHNDKADKATETHEIEDDRGGYGGNAGRGGYNRGGYGGPPGGGYGGPPGGGYGGPPGGGYGGPPGGGYGGPPGGGYGGGGCPYGCCGRGYYRRGCRCCTYAGEAVDTKPETKPQN